MPDPLHDPTEAPEEATPAPVEGTSTGDGSAGAGGSGRSRLLASLTARPGRGQILVASLLAALGFATAVQVRQTDSDGDYSGQRRGDLVALIDSLSSATDRAQSQIDDLEVTREGLQTSSQRREAALREGRDQLEVLGILTGTVAATGPGISVTVRDIQGDDTAAALLDGVEELRDAGAEAIEVNDTVRIVASSAFTQVDGVVYVDDVQLRAPYVIDAIGSSATLAEAMIFRGGFVDSVESLEGTATVERADVVEVSSLHELEPDEYARPTDR